LIDGKSIYETLHHPKFHLLVFSDARSNVQAFQKEVENEYDELVNLSVVSLHPALAEAFGTDKPFNLLLRTDCYIGHISAEISLNELKAYLSDFC